MRIRALTTEYNNIGALRAPAVVASSLGKCFAEPVGALPHAENRLSALSTAENLPRRAAENGDVMPKIIIGVDLGDARTGLAVYGRSGTIAVGCGTVRTQVFREVVEAVSEVALQQGAELIVVGNPVNMNGTQGPRSEKCRAFAKEVSELSGIPVELYDERLTTVVAHQFLSDSNVRGKKRKDSVDELSATLILQDYADRNLK